MTFSFGRLGAVLRKELREYRRSPFIIATMAVLPLVFLVEPLITIFRIGPSIPASTVDKAVGATFLILLIAPALLPAVIASYSVVGEREQGTLEPLLTTPLRREELLLGKALGVVVPAVGIAYILFAVIQICARLFASNVEVVAGLGQGSTYPGGNSLRAAPGRMVDLRRHGHFDASERRAGCTAAGDALEHPTAWGRGPGLVQRVHPSVALAAVFALVLLVADVVLFRIVSALFDRERLITGARAQRQPRGGGPVAQPGTVRRIPRSGGSDDG
jgi:ABC-type Na+ efflux pump permease subunit